MSRCNKLILAGVASMLFAVPSIVHAQSTCPSGYVICGDGCAPAFLECNSSASYYCASGDSVNGFSNACFIPPVLPALTGVETAGFSTHPVATSNMTCPAGYSNCGTGCMLTGANCCAEQGHDGYCSSATVCTTDGFCEFSGVSVTSGSTTPSCPGATICGQGCMPTGSTCDIANGSIDYCPPNFSVTPVANGSFECSATIGSKVTTTPTIAILCPTGEHNYGSGCILNNAVECAGDSICPMTTHCSSNIGYCDVSSETSHQIAGTIACSVSSSGCSDGLGNHGVGYGCYTDAYGISYCALLPPPAPADGGPPIPADGGTIITYVDGGTITTYVDGGTQVNDGGTVTTYVDGGPVTVPVTVYVPVTTPVYTDGGMITIVTYIDGGISDSGTLASADAAPDAAVSTSSPQGNAGGCSDVGYADASPIAALALALGALVLLRRGKA